MRVFFDNCTPPWLASTLNGFISQYEHRAFHIKDVEGLPGGRSAPDVVWINYLREGKDWIFITGDGRLLKNKAELTALRRSNLYGFILTPGFQAQDHHQRAANLILRWPEIEVAVQAVGAGIFEIPVKRKSKLRPMGL